MALGAAAADSDRIGDDVHRPTAEQGKYRNCEAVRSVFVNRLSDGRMDRSVATDDRDLGYILAAKVRDRRFQVAHRSRFAYGAAAAQNSG